MSRKGRTAQVLLEYQNTIEQPPVKPAQLYGTACSSDGVTIESWRKIWLDNIRANKERFGSFKEHGIGKLYKRFEHMPAIIAGSGPSLAFNGADLKKRGKIPLISCLHNYHYFEDQGVDVDFYVTLDAGEIVLEEVSEGGSKTADEYWESTKGKTLIAFIGTSPKLFEKWKGNVYLYNAPVPDQAFIDELEKIEKFNTFVSNGGNVLGACLYIAKAFFGCNPICFVGADFSFSYDKKFHGWKSKYDEKLGYVMKAVDVFGNKVLTWQSYHNFKCWFDYIALTIPGIYINCTEGGTFGAYAEGNLSAIKQMSICDFLDMFRMHEEMRDQCENPETDSKRLLF